MRKKLLIICGPTAVGKTSLGIKLSKKCGGEIISADSRQFYKQMDIATGKDLPENSKFRIMSQEVNAEGKGFDIGYYLFDRIPIWLLDIVEPDRKFTVADFYKLAWEAIRDIWERGKLPILVGGTGFYIEALIKGLETMGIGPDWLLRKELQALPVSELQGLLKKVDAQRLKRMNDSDKKNPRRLIRAIEVGLHQKRNGKKESLCLIPKMDILNIGLKEALKDIYKKIDKRVEQQVKEGAKKEVQDLVKKGYSWDLPSMTAMGYREWRDFMEGKITEEKVIEKWKYNEHGYARRQMTWFRKMSGIKWFDIAKESWQIEVEKLVKAWYI